jgi:hypothetical protein
MRGRKAKESAPFAVLSFPRIRKGLSRALPLLASWLKSRDGTEQPKRPGVSSEVALRNDSPLSIRYAYDFEGFLPEMFQRCQGLSAGGTDDHNGGTVTGVSRFNYKIHDCTRH